MLVRFATPTVRGGGTVRNLRKAGLFVATRLLPKPLENVRLGITLGNREKLELRGTVRWTSADRPQSGRVSGFGVRLEPPTAAYLAFFESLVVG